MLKLKNIIKDYPAGDEVVHALRGVSLNFRESEFVSILGQSGCGKTTMLNIIGGLDQYTDGDLVINGKSTKYFKDRDWDAYRNHSIGFVFQSYNLIPHQTVLQNVELALTLSGVSKSERRQRAIDALTQVGLGDQLKKKPNQMSGGQMQRVAIARALVNDPDILLADEPTGALDTETSVQVMEILKNISKNKLIIMVTHNPELAEKYSSRIIRLIDGKIVDDSDAYTDEDVQKDEEAKAAAEADEKSEKGKEKKLKTSMSFTTALSLSRNNLLTKKARTLLTSFAGSIGIIGIALILSVSNGVQVYIDHVQEDTLSTYPLQITETTASFGEIMQSMAEKNSDKKDHTKEDKIYSANHMGTTINTMLEETKVNNLEKFKTFLDENDEIQKLTSDIKYSYATTLNVYRAETDKEITKVNPSTLLQDIGMYSDTQMQAMSAMGGGGANVWSEMLGNEKLLQSQYDCIAGRWPEKYDEVVLVVNRNNEITDAYLYTLGIMDTSNLKGLMKRLLAGEEVVLDEEQQVYTYDELMGIRFKLVPTTDYYVKENGVWVDKSDDDDFVKGLIDDGLELKITGILRPNEDASSTSIQGAIGYTHELMTYLLKEVENSDVVQAQLAEPDTDIFTGLKFATDEDEEAEGTEETDSSSDTDSTAETDSSAEAVTESTDDTSSEIAEMPAEDPEMAALIEKIMAGEVDPSTLSEEQQMAVHQYMTASSMSADAETAQTGDTPVSSEDAEMAALLADLQSGKISTDQLTDEQTEKLAAYMSQGTGMEQGGFDMSDITQMSGMTMENMGDFSSGDFISSMSESQKKFVGSLTDEQMQLLQEMMTEQAAGLADANNGKTSKSTYEDNLTKLGYALESKPNAIDIYPVDFNAKERIVELIDQYNKDSEEADQIEYTDYIGIMMSSITSIIDAISYVLIAFVAISLIVSSIMIGIITYISVLERTKEIGILRAIGASKKDISRVFNAETVIVGFVAGVIGIGLSYLLTIPINMIIGYLTDVPMRAAIPVVAAVILVGISVILTLIAGLLPSGIAAKKDPVIALRSE